MKKTALEWFLTEFKKEIWFEPDSELDIWIKELIPKAKEMEKEQIIMFGAQCMVEVEKESGLGAIKIYELTFKQQQ
jgi:hypothetical protein